MLRINIYNLPIEEVDITKFDIMVEKPGLNILLTIIPLVFCKLLNLFTLKKKKKMA